MKTTQAQQDATRQRILACAVERMERQGFDGTTMKDIAHAAGIGDATIYKYFPSKDRLVLGYLDQAAARAIAATQQTPGLDAYGLHEKLQRLTDAVLEQLLPDREFVAEVHALARRAPLSLLSEPLAARQALQDVVAGFLEEAERGAEIARCDFKPLAGSLFVDYLAGVVGYWLADESDGFADTTQVVDLSLGLATAALQAGLVQRALQLGGFLLRSQMARLMRHGSGVPGLLRMARSALDGMPANPLPAAPPPTRPRRSSARKAAR